METSNLNSPYKKEASANLGMNISQPIPKKLRIEENPSINPSNVLCNSKGLRGLSSPLGPWRGINPRKLEEEIENPDITIRFVDSYNTKVDGANIRLDESELCDEFCIWCASKPCLCDLLKLELKISSLKLPPHKSQKEVSKTEFIKEANKIHINKGISEKISPFTHNASRQTDGSQYGTTHSSSADLKTASSTSSRCSSLISIWENIRASKGKDYDNPEKRPKNEDDQKTNNVKDKKDKSIPPGIQESRNPRNSETSKPKPYPWKNQRNITH